MLWRSNLPNPNKEKNKKLPTSGDDETTSIAFNDQVYLLDLFAANPSHNSFVVKRAPSPSVHQLDIGMVNDLVAHKPAGLLKGFLQGLTPEDYAQLSPVMKFFLVTDDDQQIPIPFVTGTDIEGNTATSGFYAGKTAGLKSVSMRVDGKTDFVSGRMYRIEITMVFDSLNTFFNPISNETSLTWADVFRSPDVQQAGTRLKFSIGYETTNSSLMSKYGLSDAFFTMYLNFNFSEMTIGENLKTTLKSKFQGFEESVASKREVFDFLKIDIGVGMKVLKAEIKKMKAEQIKVSKAVSTVQKAAQESVGLAKKKLEAQIKTLTTKNPNMSPEEIEKNPNVTGHRTALAAAEKRKTESAATGSQARKAAKAKLQDKKDQLDSLKRDKLNTALGKMLFDRDIFSTVQISSADVQRYLVALEGDDKAAIKNFLDPNAKNPSVKITKGKTTQIPPTSHKQTAPGGSKSLETLQKEREAARLALEVAKKIAKSAPTGSPTKSAFSGAKQTAQKTYDKKNKAVKQHVSSASNIGDITALKKALNEFKYIEFITLGDLLSAVMEYLLGLNKGANKELVKRQIISLTQLALRQSPVKLQISDMYNIPISLTQLRHYFADKIFGEFVDSMTIFQLFNQMVNTIQKAQQRRTVLTKSRSIAKNNYGIQFITYPVEIQGGKLVISTKAENSQGVKSGVLFTTLNSDPDFSKLNGNMSANLNNGIAHFNLGGSPTGAIKKIEISEKQVSRMKEAIYEANQGSQNRGSDSSGTTVLPAIFTTKITLCGTPYFHMGFYYYVGVPSLNISGVTNKWLHLAGYYKILGIEHAWSAGGQYITTITGVNEHTQVSIDKQQGGAAKIISNRAVAKLASTWNLTTKNQAKKLAASQPSSKNTPKAAPTPPKKKPTKKKRKKK